MTTGAKSLFLFNTLPKHVPQSITNQGAYWAGETGTIKRGEPSIIPVKSSCDLSTVFTKPTCIQAIYK